MQTYYTYGGGAAWAYDDNKSGRGRLPHLVTVARVRPGHPDHRQPKRRGRALADHHDLLSWHGRRQAVLRHPPVGHRRGIRRQRHRRQARLRGPGAGVHHLRQGRRDTVLRCDLHAVVGGHGRQWSQGGVLRRHRRDAVPLDPGQRPVAPADRRPGLRRQHRPGHPCLRLRRHRRLGRRDLHRHRLRRHPDRDRRLVRRLPITCSQQPRDLRHRRADSFGVGRSRRFPYALRQPGPRRRADAGPGHRDRSA
ncbi:hypothetical protein G5V59_24365 [Nocardioides sp. W3-2-3]|nr:hypothetical protein [Nocardioides convexus]